MDAKRFLDHLSGDEGLTDGIADAEAKAILTWVRATVKAVVAKAKDEDAAWKATRDAAERARGITKVVAALCYDEDPLAAAKQWAALGHKETLDGLPAD